MAVMTSHANAQKLTLLSPQCLQPRSQGLLLMIGPVRTREWQRRMVVKTHSRVICLNDYVNVPETSSFWFLPFCIFSNYFAYRLVQHLYTQTDHQSRRTTQASSSEQTNVDSSIILTDDPSACPRLYKAFNFLNRLNSVKYVIRRWLL